MIFYIYHTHFELRAYINFGFHSSKDNRDIARNVAAFWVIQAIETIILIKIKRIQDPGFLGQGF